MQGTVPNQIIWKRDSTDVKQEALEIVVAMGTFAGSNYDLVALLNKEIQAKEQKLQMFKQGKSWANEHHQNEQQNLNNNYED